MVLPFTSSPARTMMSISSGLLARSPLRSDTGASHAIARLNCYRLSWPYWGRRRVRIPHAQFEELRVGIATIAPEPAAIGHVPDQQPNDVGLGKVNSQFVNLHGFGETCASSERGSRPGTSRDAIAWTSAYSGEPGARLAEQKATSIARRRSPPPRRTTTARWPRSRVVFGSRCPAVVIA